MNRNECRKIGLTGGIGAGKSTVSARFRALGAFVLDADEISRALLDPDGACFARVCALFPEAVKEDGRLDRRKIASVVFSDSNMLEELNRIIHPAVIELMHADADAFLLAHPGRIVLYDVPLLIECGMQDAMDRVIVVVADDAVRMERVMRRDGCTREEAQARFRAQMPQEMKLQYADDIIDNSGSIEQLYYQIDRLYARMHDGGDT